MPYSTQNDGLGGSANVHGVMSSVLASKYCALTDYHYYLSPPDSRNQVTMYHADVLYNLYKTWVIGGFSGKQCDMGIEKTHEFGHALGLGHTLQTGQLMWYAEQNGVFTPQSRDICGFNRIYVQHSC